MILDVSIQYFFYFSNKISILLHDTSFEAVLQESI